MESDRNNSIVMPKDDNDRNLPRYLEFINSPSGRKEPIAIRFAESVKTGGKAISHLPGG